MTCKGKVCDLVRTYFNPPSTSQSNSVFECDLTYMHRHESEK